MMDIQGVVCCSLDDDLSIKDTLTRLLEIEGSSVIQNIPCLELRLQNKYYQATIHLIDYDNLTENERISKLLENSQAIILLGNGQRLTVDQLDEKVKLLNDVGGEPRILLYHGIEADSEPHKTLTDWSIKNGYDFIDIDDNAKSQLIDSLSAYKWKIRINENKPQLNDEMLRKLTDFDNLLGKLNAYRDMPELRGNPDDQNIVEIAEILSGLLGEDVDGFLENEDD